MDIVHIGEGASCSSLYLSSCIRFFTAPDIDSAFELIEREKVEAVVLDLPSLPGWPNNIEIAETLLKRVDRPVIVLGDASSRLSREVLELGAQDYLNREDLNGDLFSRILLYSVSLHRTSASIQQLFHDIDRIKEFGRPFQSFFEHSPIGMVLLDFEGKLVRTNRALQEILDYSETDLRDQPLSLFIESGSSLYFLEKFQQLCDGESSFLEMESRYNGRNSREGWWRISASVVQDFNGRPKFVYSIVKDISQWKQNEVDLVRARNLAEESTRTKSEFLANMSHEIRTPIHTITGMTELLINTDLDVEQRAYSEQVRFSADVLLSLINDILDFSKIEAGKLHLELVDLDLYTMVENAVDLVTLEAHHKGLEVVIYIRPNVPHLLKGDPTRLRQIIVNLVNNAVKFTRTGEVNISVELEAEDEARVTLKVNVKDTGIGISKDRQARLFRSFSQADSSTTRKFGGTGLGLTISKNLVNLMGGRIGVESKKGEGANFWFTAVLEKQAKDSFFNDVPENFFEELRVLVVDDNASSRELLTEYLCSWGCVVAQADRGERVLESLRAATAVNPFDLVLIDLKMPGIDGWQLASEIHSDKNIGKVRLILLQPAGFSVDEAKMMLLKWFDGYLSKPVKRADLLATVFWVINSDIDLESIELEEDQAEAEALEEDVPAWQDAFEILVVEDHEVNQKLFQTILEKLGYHISLAADGLEALQRVQEQQFHLILMDVQMPNMNGYDATRKMREMGIETPIVAVSASAIKEEVDMCFESGMNDHLTKPFKQKDLLPVLEKWLSGAELFTTPEVAETDATAPRVGDRGSVDPQVFDLEQAVATFMGNRDVVINVLKAFVPKVEGQLQVLEEALDKEDFVTIRAEAHSIKGGSLNLEVKQLGHEARILEEAGRNRDKELARSAFSAVKDAFAVFKSVVSALIR